MGVGGWGREEWERVGLEELTNLRPRGESKRMNHQKFPTKACWGQEWMLMERTKTRGLIGNRVALCPGDMHRDAGILSFQVD